MKARSRREKKDRGSRKVYERRHQRRHDGPPARGDQPDRRTGRPPPTEQGAAVGRRKEETGENFKQEGGISLLENKRLLQEGARGHSPLPTNTAIPLESRIARQSTTQRALIRATAPPPRIPPSAPQPAEPHGPSNYMCGRRRRKWPHGQRTGARRGTAPWAASATRSRPRAR